MHSFIHSAVCSDVIMYAWGLLWLVHGTTSHYLLTSNRCRYDPTLHNDNMEHTGHIYWLSEHVLFLCSCAVVGL